MRDYGTTNALPYASAPAVGLTGDTYWNTTEKALYVSDGTVWVKAGPSAGGTATTIAATPPAGPTQGQMWWRNDPDGNLFISYNDGNTTQWVPAVPTTAPPSGAAGGDLSGTYPNPDIKALAVGTPEIADGAVTFVKLGERVHCSLLRASGKQSIPNGTSTEFIWTQASVDVGGAWNVTQPTRLTIPTTGTYLVGASIAFGANATGAARRFTISRPAIINLAIGDARPATMDQMVNASFIATFTAGEFITVAIYHDAGAALLVGDDGWGPPARFWLTRIG